MFRETALDQLPVENNFRLRGYQGTRMDGLTDGIFALAVAVLLISSSVPANFDELLVFVYDLFPFALCILFIYWIWRALTTFNLRYGLDDPGTIKLKMLLMFFLLFYIYPLKFLMSWQVKYFSALARGEMNERYAELSRIIPFTKIPELMIIYGVGFVLVFGLVYRLFRRAWNRREVLQLNALERLETRAWTRRYRNFALIGVLSVLIAWVSMLTSFAMGAIIAGVAYNLVWISIILEVRWRKRQERRLELA